MWSSDLPSLTDYQVFKNLFISFKLVEVVTILAFTLFNVSLFPDQLTTVSIKNKKNSTNISTNPFLYNWAHSKE